MNGKISLQDGRHNDDNFVGNCVEKVNTELKNLSESREIEKMWNQFKSRYCFYNITVLDIFHETILLLN